MAATFALLVMELPLYINGCRRAVRLHGGKAVDHQVCVDLFQRLNMPPSVLSEKGKHWVHERRRTALREVAVMWSLILDLFMLSLFAAQLSGYEMPVVEGFALLITVPKACSIIGKLADMDADLTPDRLNRDMAIVNVLILGASLACLESCYLVSIWLGHCVSASQTVSLATR